MDSHRRSLKPCPFCGGRAVMLIESRVLARCVWVECSSCKVTGPMIEYGSAWEDMALLDARLREARSQAAANWNTRAGDGSAGSSPAAD